MKHIINNFEIAILKTECAGSHNGNLIKIKNNSYRATPIVSKKVKRNMKKYKSRSKVFFKLHGS